MAYSKSEIISMCEAASKDMKSFYKQNFINYRGKTKGDERDWYTEIIAEWLLGNIGKFNEIHPVVRNNGYNQNHSGELGEMTIRVEEYVAKQLFNSKKKYKGIGEIIDYQTPLKNPGGTENAGLGKIDLLSRNDETKCVYILELKKDSSEETMLRCVLEGYTYLRLIPKENLFKSFGIPSDYELKAAPLVYFGGVQYKEYNDKKRKYLLQLMKELKISPFFMKEILSFDIDS